MLTPSQRRKIRKIFSPIRRMGLKKKFTIISNNCWGGIAYDKLGLEYTTPTVGLLFKPSDFLKYISNLEYYLSFTPEPIPERQVKENEHQGLYAAKLDDITIFFIHYKNVYDGIEKYERRKKRIVYDNIIIKFSDINYDDDIASEDIMEKINAIQYKKIIFSKNKELCRKNTNFIYFEKVDSSGNILNEFKQANKLFSLKKLKKLINS